MRISDWSSDVCSSDLLAATSLAGETITYSYDALGRLVAVQSAGTINNNQAHSICYDPSGNRTQYKSSGTGSIAGCAPTPTPSPTPTPTPTPTPNTPPIAVNDSKSVTCQQYVTHNLTANDSDLDGDLPLTITALSRISGSATATIASASSVEIYSAAIGPPKPDRHRGRAHV